MTENRRKRWWIALLEVVVPHSKQLATAAILWLGLGAGAGYLGGDMLKKPKVPVSENSVTKPTEAFCNQDDIVRICREVMAGHEAGPLH